MAPCGRTSAIWRILLRKPMQRTAASLVLLAAGAGPVLAATCYRPNPAGGSIPYECVRGEELKAGAPGLGQSNIPVPDQRELDAIRKTMEGVKAAEEPVQAAPSR